MQNLYLRGLCMALCCMLIPAHMLAQDDHPQSEIYATWDENRSAWIPTEKIERDARPALGWERSRTFTWDQAGGQWSLTHTMERWADAEGHDTLQLQQVWRQGADRSWQQIRKQLRYHPRHRSIISEKVTRETRTGRISGTWQRYYFNEAGCQMASSTWEQGPGANHFTPRDSVHIRRDIRCQEEGRALYIWQRGRYVVDHLSRYQYDENDRGLRTVRLEEKSGDLSDDWFHIWTKRQKLTADGQLLVEEWRQANGIAVRDSFAYDRSGRDIAKWQWLQASVGSDWQPESAFRQVYMADGQIHIWEQQRAWDARAGQWTHRVRTENRYRADGQLETRERELHTPRGRETLLQQFDYRCDGRREMTTQYLDQGFGRSPLQQATFHFGSSAPCEFEAGQPALAAYPNPSQHQVFLRSTLLQEGPAQIRITDPAGRVRWQQRVENWHSPVFSIRPDLDPGVYIITIRRGDQQARTKIRVE